jgi:hypothetical protein
MQDPNAIPIPNLPRTYTMTFKAGTYELQLDKFGQLMVKAKK